MEKIKALMSLLAKRFCVDDDEYAQEMLFDEIRHFMPLIRDYSLCNKTAILTAAIDETFHLDTDDKGYDDLADMLETWLCNTWDGV